jgi:hypothetical protein
MIGYFFFKEMAKIAKLNGQGQTQYPILELYFGLFACVSTSVQNFICYSGKHGWFRTSETFNTYIHISGRLQLACPGTKKVGLVTLTV